jgi:hypothetical protein
MRGVATTNDPIENLVYTYWMTVVQLLKNGIPWEAIQLLSEGEITFIIGIISAFRQKEEEDEQRSMSKLKF